MDDPKSQFLKPDPQSQNIFLDLKMEALQKIVLPGKVHPVRNSSRYDSKKSGALFLTG
jgi:hypothetical protein